VPQAPTGATSLSGVLLGDLDIEHRSEGSIVYCRYSPGGVGLVERQTRESG